MRCRLLYGRGMNSIALSRRRGIAMLLLTGLILMALVLVNLFRLAPILNLHPASPTTAPTVAAPWAGARAPEAAPAPAMPTKQAPTQAAPNEAPSESEPRSGAPNYLQDAGEGTTNPPPAVDCLKGKCPSSG